MKVEIIIKGKISQQWESWFEGLSITRKGNNTILSGNVVDESAFHGILNQIRDLNLKLISAQVIR
ncbi:hypothetical protein HNS38_16145 [Lentimicrobium sp. L6]|nr:hypothetical protein [Lentimicrobium sp. S6]NPD86305.1 hypothetical protein [Lentimicrobium sp. L6]